MDSGILSLDRLLKALADPTRLRILGLLLGGEVCVCDIHESLGIPQPRASRHLATLRQAGLVTARRDGLWMHYRLADLPDPVLTGILQAVTHALTHLAVVREDSARLERQTGCCRPLPQPGPGRPCCTEEGR